MQTLLVVLTVLISVLLIIVVLIQKSKGGGLASNFAGSNQIMGVRRTNDFIEKATWTLAIIILVLSVLSSFVSGGEKSGRAKYNVNAQTEQTQAADFSSTALTSDKAAAEAGTEATETAEATEEVVLEGETATADAAAAAETAAEQN